MKHLSIVTSEIFHIISVAFQYRTIIKSRITTKKAAYIYMYIDIVAYHNGVKYACTKGVLSSTALTLQVLTARAVSLPGITCLQQNIN